jgi:hypothetical protein
VTLAARSPDARFTSVDISATSIETARHRTEAAGYHHVRFLQVVLGVEHDHAQALLLQRRHLGDQERPDVVRRSDLERGRRRLKQRATTEFQRRGEPAGGGRRHDTCTLPIAGDTLGQTGKTAALLEQAARGLNLDRRRTCVAFPCSPVAMCGDSLSG